MDGWIRLATIAAVIFLVLAVVFWIEGEGDNEDER
jgi:hypothetical protein